MKNLGALQIVASLLVSSFVAGCAGAERCAVSLLNDPAKLKRFGDASIKRAAEAFSFDDFIRKHRELYAR